MLLCEHLDNSILVFCMSSQMDAQLGKPKTFQVFIEANWNSSELQLGANH